MVFSRENQTKLRGAVEAQTSAVQTEKELSERSLLNILLANIAERLKRQKPALPWTRTFFSGAVCGTIVNSPGFRGDVA